MAVQTYSSKEKIQLQPNFKSTEFKCKCGCETMLHDDKLSAYLQKIREHFGKPVHITSGYRCAKHNKKVGGSSGSRHTKGQAADFWVEGVKPAEVAKYAECIGVKGIGLYEAGDGNFVHIDTRTSKSFWYGHGQAYRATFGGEPIYTREQFLTELREALGCAGCDEDLVRYTITVGAKYNNTQPCIKPVQKWLKALGYKEVDEADGVAGAKFASAVLHFQQDRGCAMTGIMEEWGRTWQELMAAERGAAQ